MTLWRNLLQAWRGWVSILRGEVDWQLYFTLTLPGLVAALALFLLAAFLTIVVAALNVGVPTLSEFIATMLVQSLCVLALLAGIYATRAAVPAPVRVLNILVPGVYAMVAYLLVGAVLSLFSGMALLALWVALAFLLYRLARIATEWSGGVSAAFAVLTVVLLAALPMTLYMLVGPVAVPAP